MIRARIIAVGDELLVGRTVDSNSGRVQRALAGRGVACERVTVVPDRQEAIVAALAETTAGGLVVLTGGLGSTLDDLTREAVAAWAGEPLLADEQTAAALQERCRARGWSCGEDMLRQAQRPRGLECLPNPVGSAPGLVGRLRERWLALLPGVPAELEGLLPLVAQWLQDRGAMGSPLPALYLRTAQMPELALARLCEPVRARHAELAWSWWLSEWGVDLRVGLPAGRADDGVLRCVRSGLLAVLGQGVFGEGAASLPEVVLKLLQERGLSLAVAESCTGGLLGAALTGVPGSSASFRGGIISYADQVKETLLSVPRRLLAEEGAVSAPVALAMARECRRVLSADYALAITGVAGPGGGSAAKPVGTTWTAVAGPPGAVARGYRFVGGRERNRQLAVAAALDNLRLALADPSGLPPQAAAGFWSLEPPGDRP